jgi:2-dehydro-3-deoxyphosphogalactonate aldolase
LESIATLARMVGDRALVGAGTVTSAEEVDRVAQAGGRLIVSPNCDVGVITHAAAKGLVTLPGVLTPTEMFAAMKAGASGLKIFPAELFPPAAIRAVRAVLPKDTPVYVVGGITAKNMGDYLRAGASGFGIGSSLYRAGKSLAEVATDAKSIVAAFHSAYGDSR